MKFRLVEENELEKTVKKHKKHQKGLSPFCYLNPNAGNVEKNIEMFNNSTNTDSVSLGSGEAVSEMLEEESSKLFNQIDDDVSDLINESEFPSYTFVYEGPVYRFERVYDRKCKPVYTDARTNKQAVNFIKGKLKARYGFSMNAKLDIDESKVKKVENPYGYEEEVGRQKIEFPEDDYVGDFDGDSVYFKDGYYWVDGIEQPFISVEDIYDYLESE